MIHYNGRKIPAEKDGYVDNIIHDIVDPLSNMAHSFGLTPNFITYFSLIFCVLAIYYFHKRSYLSILFFSLYVISDFLDGHTARKFDQVTSWGDLCDHIRDFLTLFPIIIMIFYQTNLIQKHPAVFILFLVLTYCALCYVGMQEREYDLSSSLNFSRNFYASPSVTKIFSSGTWYIFIAMLMYMVIKNDGKF